MKFYGSFWLFLSAIFMMDAYEKPTILIKMPTRSHPKQFFQYLDRYYAFLSGEYSYYFVISCDVDDETMNNQEVRNKLSQYPHLSVYYSENKSKIQACNADIDKHQWDIVLLASDDMMPLVKGYDKIIIELMIKRFPDFDGVLNFNDGSNHEMFNGLPVLGKKYYQRFGYIYHPSYLSWWCDCELLIVSKFLDKALYSSQVIMKHNQAPSNILFQRDAQLDHIDAKTFFDRKDHYFDIDSAVLESNLEKKKSLFYIHDRWKNRLK